MPMLANLSLKKAVSCYESALKADQQYATAHFNRGCLKLKMGDFKEGWPEYEWRWENAYFPPFQLPH